MAHYLGIHSLEMSISDVKQSLWALAVLHLPNPNLAFPIIRRARDLARDLETPDIVDALKVLSWIKRDTTEAVYDLTRRFTSSDKWVRAKPSPQEAASILCSLGKLSFRDEEVFKYLTSIVIDSPEQTGAQAFTNVLWAHSVVKILPPRELRVLAYFEKKGLMSPELQIDIID
jgi:hypothetical protein